jgi:hypothetical protein
LKKVVVVVDERRRNDVGSEVSRRRRHDAGILGVSGVDPQEQRWVLTVALVVVHFAMVETRLRDGVNRRFVFLSVCTQKHKL